MTRPFQLELFPEAEPPRHKESTSGSFVDNMQLPVHRWFRFSAGFSGAWARNVIAQEAANAEVRVFDPFAGSGTTLIASEQCGVPAQGIDPHPFAGRVARAKLAYRSSPDEFVQRATEIVTIAERCSPNVERYAPLIQKCYTSDALAELDSLRQAVVDNDNGDPTSQLVWLTLASILRSTAHVGTANWQYILPNKRKAKVKRPLAAYEEMAHIIYQDMHALSHLNGPRAVFDTDDARSCEKIPRNSFNLVVTSPPYPNNYDYADATRLEMTFFGEIESWGDLQQSVRRHLLRSCTQHVPERAVNIEAVIEQEEVSSIREELREVCEKLAKIRLGRGGKKTYHNMVACYFFDLAQVWRALRRVLDSPSRVCFVIGDSAPYGVYVPVIRWLGRLALAAGFNSFLFEKTRDRNTKWKNRKHRVPLCEGRLWVEG